MLNLDEPSQKTASGPLSLRMASSLSPISLIACSQVILRYLPSTSFIGVLRRCECSVMPCSRTEAPLAQCAPRLSGESNTGSWRTHTPFCTCASTAQPTEQCVQTVRFTSILPPLASAAALASPIMLSGSWLANAAAPAVMPVPFRNARRSTVFAARAPMARDSGLARSARPSDLRLSSMVGLLRLAWSCSTSGCVRRRDSPVSSRRGLAPRAAAAACLPATATAAAPAVPRPAVSRNFLRLFGLLSLFMSRLLFFAMNCGFNPG